MKFLVLAFLMAVGIPYALSAQTFDAKGTMVLEAESFKLVQADIVADATASGGKAVKILGADSVGTLEVTLDVGKYKLFAVENSPDGAHDAFHIGVDAEWARVFPDEYEKWIELPKGVDFEMTAKGKKTIVFRTNWPGIKKPGEDGMLIDKLIIKKK